MYCIPCILFYILYVIYFSVSVAICSRIEAKYVHNACTCVSAPEAKLIVIETYWQREHQHGWHLAPPQCPVNSITWCPLNPDVFLSCSSDWTIHLWKQDNLHPVLSFTSTQRAVHNIKWSPKWATVFGAVIEGQLEIWDLNSSLWVRRVENLFVLFSVSL